MGHDVHFLQRLERYSPPHVELAMSLYRDPELMKGLLSHHKIPDGADRLAIAMTDAPDGPRIVVQRNGHFVTALGEGMAADLPVISRAALDAAISKREAFRALLEEARRVAGPTGISGKVLLRVAQSGQWLSREEMASLLVWTQMGGAIDAFYAAMIDVSVRLRESLMRGRRLRDITRLAHLKRAFWESQWACVHLQGALAHSGRGFLDRIPEDVVFESYEITWADRIFPSLMRSAWALTRLGKLVMPILRKRWAEPEDPEDVIALALLAATIANGHSKLRGQAEKLFHRPPGPDAWDDSREAREVWHRYRDTMVELFKLAVYGPAQALQRYRTFGSLAAFELTRKLPDDSPWKYPTPGDVPDEIAYGAMLLVPFQYEVDVPETLALGHSPAWLGKATLEETYLPGDFLKAVKFEFKPALVDQMLQRLRDREGLRTLKYDTPKVGRNDPCPCDSGKKFKKCCLAS